MLFYVENTGLPPLKGTVTFDERTSIGRDITTATQPSRCTLIEDVLVGLGQATSLLGLEGVVGFLAEGSAKG